MPNKQAAPWYLWAVGAVAILWNGMGTVLWAGTTFLPATFLAGMPPIHREYVASLPLWSTLAWALGVLSGLIGSILLLLRKPQAEREFALSLLGAAANTMVYFTNPPPPGFFNLGLQVFINGFALFLLWFAHSMKRRNIITP